MVNNVIVAITFGNGASERYVASSVNIEEKIIKINFPDERYTYIPLSGNIRVSVTAEK